MLCAYAAARCRACAASLRAENDLRTISSRRCPAMVSRNTMNLGATPSHCFTIARLTVVVPIAPFVLSPCIFFTQMNLHVCGLEVASELAEIMCVSRQIISPQSNKPIINLVQDSVVAEFLMTAATQRFTRAQASQIVMAIQHPLPGKPLLPPPQQTGPEEFWTGKQIFSLLIPEGVYLDERVRDGGDQNEGHVVVLNGELVKGKLCKRSMSALIHVIFNDCGHEVAGRFISDAQRILVEYLLVRGFSVGIKDCIDAPGATQGVAKIVAETFAHVTHTYTTGRGMPAATVEACVTKSLQTVITRAGGVVRSCILPDNGFAIMVESGAKGSPINLAQILGVVGQQSVEGARIAPAAAGNRTLPCFMAGDASPAARGFVVNSYVRGLTPQEYFTHAMGGREGLADTAVKTANTGYLQRRMMTMMMNLKVAYDGTVRNARDEVVQDVYGGDGYDSTALEKKSVPGFKAGREEALAWAGDAECATQFLLLQKRLRAAWLISGVEVQTTVYMPFDVLRVIARHAGRKSSSARATNADVASTLDGLCADMVATLGDLPTLSTRAYLRYWFTPRLVVTERGMSRDDLRAAAAEIERKFHRAVVQPGEMVGAVGASSIGEPMTQLTLNTFHYAGVGSKNVTLGVPRLKELIDVSHNIKTPSLTVRFPSVLSTNETHVRMLSAALEHLPLVRVVQSSSVELEPDVWGTRFEEDAHPLRLAAGMHNPGEGVDKFSKWVARFKVDKAQLMQRNLTVTHVADAMRRFLAGDAQVVRSEPSMMDWVVRVRMRDMPLLLQDVLEEGGDSLALERIMMQEIHDHLLDIPVQGVPGIKKASVRLERYSCVVPATGALEVRSEWVADTQGTNLEAVMELSGVDARRTTSNDIHEIAQNFGIEVASRVLYDEIKNVLSFDGTYVNERHVRLLVDAMTRTGSALPVTRHGMRELGSGVFARASFEETLEVINQAAAFGEKDPLRGVTEAVLIGKLAPAGTGSMSIISKATLKPAPAPRAVLVAPLVRERFDASSAFHGSGGAGSEPPSLIVRPLPPRHALLGHTTTMEVDYEKELQPPEHHQAPEQQEQEHAETLPWVGRKRIKKDQQHSGALEQQQQEQKQRKASAWVYTPLSPKVATSSWTYVPKSPPLK